MKSSKPWYYKMLVILAIPPMLIYYRILQPPVVYIKALIAEQDGSLYRSGPVVKTRNPKKAFIAHSAKVLVSYVIAFAIRYWWLILSLFTAWLIYDIGLAPALETLAIWSVLWLLYRSFRKFRRDIR